MKNKIFFAAAAAALLAFGCTSGDKSVTVKVENPSDFDRSAELVEVPQSQLSKVALAAGQAYIVTDAAGNVVPSQLTYDGKLVFQSGVDANASAQYTVTAGEPREYEARTYGRFVPERLDDFVWENDRVAFRAYGPALIAKDGPSTGVDAWYKRTSKLVVDEWYADEFAGVKKYHDDHGEGMDDYTVGPTLGAGFPAVYVDGEMVKNKNFVDYEVFENGPLRTTFTLVYDDLDVNGAAVSEKRTVSIDAGSQMNRITVDYGFAEPTDIVAGFPVRDLSDEYITGDDYILYLEPPTRQSHNVWLGVVMPGMKEYAIDTYTVPAGEKQPGDYHHLLAVKEYTPGTPVTYYAGFGWEKWGFPTVESFRTYLENTSAALANPLKVTVE